jgi:Berberine and berberine like
VPILAQWADPSETSVNVAWARETFNQLEPLADAGVYVNNLGVEGGDRVKAAYGDNYARLGNLKSAYDRTNFFRMNQNIQPSPRGNSG